MKIIMVSYKKCLTGDVTAVTSSFNKREQWDSALDCPKIFTF